MKLNVKKLLPIIIAVAAVIVIAVVIILAVNALSTPKEAFVVPEADMTFVYVKEDDESILMRDGAATEITVNGKVQTQYIRYSLDGATVAYLDENDSLYVVYDGEENRIKKNVVSFRLSADGSTVAYVNNKDELVLVDLKTEDEKIVTEDIYSSDYALSPNGRSVLYAEGDEDAYTVFVYVNGEVTELEGGEGCLPIGIADKAKYVYYADEDGALYVKSGKKDAVKLAKEYYTKSGRGVSLNADHTQIIYWANEEAVYVSVNGDDDVKLTAKGISYMPGTEDGYTTMGTEATTLPIRDVRGLYFIDGDNDLRYIEKDLSTSRVDKDVMALKVTDTIDMVYYVDEDGGLYRGKGGSEDFERIARDVTKFDITSDGKTCYYLDDEDTLIYVDKKGEDTKICKEVASFCITPDDYVLYLTDYEKESALISKGKLYGCKNGKEGELIAKDVFAVSATETGAYYICDLDIKATSATCDIYGASKKLEFEKIVENVSLY